MIFRPCLSEMCIMPLGVSAQVFLRIKACEDRWLNISSLKSDLQSDVMHISVFCFRQKGKINTNITFIDVLPLTTCTAITKYPCKSSYLFPFYFVWNILRYLGWWGILKWMRKAPLPYLRSYAAQDFPPVK